ncbi:MAG: phosphatidylinositol-specific phospholipase C domain-containing protein [Chloroflexota bacterium]
MSKVFKLLFSLCLVWLVSTSVSQAHGPKDRHGHEDYEGPTNFNALPKGKFPLFDEKTKSGGSYSDTAAPQRWLISAAKDWMARLPDETELKDISIPGTHDSGARRTNCGSTIFHSPFFQNQTWSIDQQLNAGIRYLDIRVRRTKRSFAIHHAECYQRLMFGNVMTKVEKFLKDHPGETILMSIQEEHDAEPGSKAFREIWEGYMNKYGYLFLTDIKSLPTLGEARGKIIVLRGGNSFPGEGVRSLRKHDGKTGYGLWIKNKKIDRQNHWEVESPFTTKKRLINDYIDRAAKQEKFILNHLSGTDIPWSSPSTVAKATNAFAYKNIRCYGGKRTLGVLIMDYPGEHLIYQILKSNFSSSKSVSYTFTVKTADKYLAGTDSDIYFILYGKDQYGRKKTLSRFEVTRKISGDALERDDKEVFTLCNQPRLHKVDELHIHSAGSDDWQVDYVDVKFDGVTKRV